MAEEDLLAQLEATPEGAAAAPKKSKMMMIVIIIVALLALGGGGFYAYKTFFQKKAPAGAKEKGAKEEAGKEGAKEGEKEGEKKAEEEKEEPEVGVMFSLDPFIVNLAGSEGKRFLKVTISLELSSPEVRAEVNENLQKISDAILILLSSKTFEDVYSIQGKFKLKDEITTRVNRFMMLGHVKDVYFTEFVIQ